MDHGRHRVPGAVAALKAEEGQDLHIIGSTQLVLTTYAVAAETTPASRETMRDAIANR